MILGGNLELGRSPKVDAERFAKFPGDHGIKIFVKMLRNTFAK